MLSYLVVILEEQAVPFCHYSPREGLADPSGLMTIETLRLAVDFARNNSLAVNFIYGATPLPDQYSEIIESINNVKIAPSGTHHASAANIVVVTPKDINQLETSDKQYVILRCDKMHLPDLGNSINRLWGRFKRLNICFTDIGSFTEDDIGLYRSQLQNIGGQFIQHCRNGLNAEVNSLTDRIGLKGMRNCGAGTDHITVAPNGRLYICPAFYFDDIKDEIGDLSQGPQIANAQLLQLDHAPICSRCDAFQCKRCVYLNRLLTRELNTPSWQQCRLAHAEREASQQLASRLCSMGILSNSSMIQPLDYDDPFLLVTQGQQKEIPQPGPESEENIQNLSDRELLNQIYRMQLAILERLR